MMNTSNTGQFREDDESACSLSSGESDESIPDIDDDLRLERIADFQRESLRLEDNLDASFGAHTGGLMNLAARYEKLLIKVMDEGGTSILTSTDVRHAFSTHYNLSRQIDRNMNLADRRAEERRRAEKARSQRQLAALQDSAGGGRRRN